ncbi:hypothetical protein BKA93DRAFT_774468 [Sparassis latifolia]
MCRYCLGTNVSLTCTAQVSRARQLFKVLMQIVIIWHSCCAGWLQEVKRMKFNLARRVTDQTWTPFSASGTQLLWTPRFSDSSCILCFFLAA